MACAVSYASTLQSPGFSYRRAVSPAPMMTTSFPKVVRQVSPPPAASANTLVSVAAPSGSDDLHICSRFDPTLEPLRSQLIGKLGLASNASLTVLSGGFQNDGIWLLRDGSKGLILKLAKSQQMTLSSEAQKIRDLCRKFPSMKDDPSLAFPSHIFRCLQKGSHVYDLIVMPQASGQSIAEIMAKKSRTQPAELMRIMSEVGRCISGFHSRYPGHQHNDFHASNVLFDETSGRITLIDLCDIAPKLALAISDTDYFANSLERMSYPRQLCMECKRNLEMGYGMGKQVVKAAKASYAGSVRLLARY